MPKEYTREQLRQLYIKLPEEIKEMASADETAAEIEEICKRNGIVDERVGTISDLIRDVLFGLMPPEEFQATLEEELKLEKETAKKVTREINRFIFYPVRPALEQLYRIEKVPTEKEAGKPTERKTEEKGPDIYREPIE